MSAKTDLALHQASALVSTDPKTAFSLVLAAGVRLDSGVQHEGNSLLRRAGFDGNARFNRVGEALSRAFDVLSKVGIEQGEVISARELSGDKGTTTIDLAFSNPEDPFSPEAISNSVLAFSWTKLAKGQFEVVAYLS